MIPCCPTIKEQTLNLFEKGSPKEAAFSSAEPALFRYIPVYCDGTIQEYRRNCMVDSQLNDGLWGKPAVKWWKKTFDAYTEKDLKGATIHHYPAGLRFEVGAPQFFCIPETLVPEHSYRELQRKACLAYLEAKYASWIPGSTVLDKFFRQVRDENGGDITWEFILESEALNLDATGRLVKYYKLREGLELPDGFLLIEGQDDDEVFLTAYGEQPIAMHGHNCYSFTNLSMDWEDGPLAITDVLPSAELLFPDNEDSGDDDGLVYEYELFCGLETIMGSDASTVKLVKKIMEAYLTDKEGFWASKCATHAVMLLKAWIHDSPSEVQFVWKKIIAKQEAF
eukprot:scaffold1131_cov229-Pinguiococcus_pyrenoidosus.AAC.1